MAVVGTSYSQWMRDNPELVQQAQDAYAQRQQPAPAATPPVQSAPTPPPQPQQNAPAPQTVQAQQAQEAGQVAPVTPVQSRPAPMAKISSGAPGGTATAPNSTGFQGAVDIAKTIASIYFGGGMGAATTALGSGGKAGQRMAETYGDNVPQQKSSGGNMLGNAMGIISMFKGGK